MASARGDSKSELHLVEGYMTHCMPCLGPAIALSVVREFSAKCPKERTVGASFLVPGIGVPQLLIGKRQTND